MTQELINEIKELKPHIPCRSIRVILKSIYWRSKKYQEIFLSRRNSSDLWIKENHYRIIVELLRDFGYITIENKHDKTLRLASKSIKVKKYGYKVSDFFQKILNTFEKTKVYISNITDRIKQFNSSHNTFEYLKGYWVVKYNKLIIWDRYIAKRKWKYSDFIYDSYENKKLTLFEYLREWKELITFCRELNLIW